MCAAPSAAAQSEIGAALQPSVRLLFRAQRARIASLIWNAGCAVDVRARVNQGTVFIPSVWLGAAKWHPGVRQPCRVNVHRVDFSPAFAREVWHGPYRSRRSDSGSM